MRITCSQAPSTQPSQPKPPSKPPPKTKKGPKKVALVSQSLNAAVPPMVPDWGPLPGIGGTAFSHPTLNEDNDPYFLEPVLLTNSGDDRFVDDATTDPSNSLPSPRSALPHINVPPPPHVNLTSHAVIPHLDLRKLPNKRKLSMPAGSTSCRSAPVGNEHPPSSTPSTSCSISHPASHSMFHGPHSQAPSRSPSPHSEPLDPTLSASCFPPVSPSIPLFEPESDSKEALAVHLLDAVSTTPSGPSSHPPHFTAAPSLSCTAPSTCLLLSHAQLKYKTCVLIKHAFPEQSSWWHLFACEAWETAHDKYRPDDGTNIAFSGDIERIISSQGTNLIKLVPMSYHFNKADPCIHPLIAQNLLEDGNLIYPKVYFHEHGAIWCSQWNREYIILHKEPPFSHPILTQVVNMLAFQGHPLIVLVALDLFNLIPLPQLLLHVPFTLAHYVPGADSTKCMKFLADDYHPVYQKYTDALRKFKQYPLDICATTQRRFWDEGRVAAKIPDEESLDTITFSRGMSEATIVAELAQLQQPPLPPQPEPHFMPPQQPSIFS
ncbi:hypothetical protein K439DRAFT_1625032 [Ramaria rubella]|nr:hypothetical protein K439DRAFT_1625032 [Ramaria rubella]